jgi:thioesterase domain-containing protein
MMVVDDLVMNALRKGLDVEPSDTPLKRRAAVSLRQAGGQRPLYILHGAGGDVLPFTELASLLPEGFPIYGLQVVEDAQAISIERLAAHHIETMRRLQPRGPYRLIGHALGGLVAYEIATQLIGEDEQVEFLGIIDTHRSMNEPGEIGTINAEQSQTYRACMDAARRYAPQRLSMPVHLLAADRASGQDASCGWGTLLGKQLYVSEVGGTHVSMLKQPHVQRLADRIAVALTMIERRRVVPPELIHSPIITIQGGLQKPSVHDRPVFCVPGAGASVTSFLPLAQALGTSAAIYGLQPRGLDGELVPHASVEAAACHYIKALKSEHPRGPYRLVGHSFGGWVVFEMACQLFARGDSVDPIILLDSQPPPLRSVMNHYYAREATLIKLVSALEESSGREISLTRQQLEALDYESQHSELLKAMKSIGVVSRLDAVRRLVRVFATHLNTPYVTTRTFPGRALLIRAGEPSVRRADDYELEPLRSTQAWLDYLPHVEIVSLPGNHMTMLKEPNIDIVASRIWEAWRTNAAHSRAQPHVIDDGGTYKERGRV